METACALSGSAKSSREIRCPRAENPGVGLSGRVSDVSGVVTILPSAPPPSPSDLRAAMRAQQAHIIMHSEATAIMHATTSADATGLVLHCSEAGSSTWPAPSRWWTGSSACLSGEFLLHSGSDAAHAARLKYTVITCGNRSTSGLALRPRPRPSSSVSGEGVEDLRDSGTAEKVSFSTVYAVYPASSSEIGVLEVSPPVPPGRRPRCAAKKRRVLNQAAAAEPDSTRRWPHGRLPWRWVWRKAKA